MINLGEYNFMQNTSLNLYQLNEKWMFLFHFTRRELTFTFAICYCPAVCRLSETLVHPTRAVEIFGNISTAFGTLAIRWHPQKFFYGDRPRGTPPPGELNTRGVAKYSVLDLSKAISRKRCKIRGKLVVITNRNSQTSFRLVPKSVTLNDLERRNGPYFASFHGIFVYDVVTKQLFGLPRFQNLLLIVYDHIRTICAIIQWLLGQNKLITGLMGVGA